MKKIITMFFILLLCPVLAYSQQIGNQGANRAYTDSQIAALLAGENTFNAVQNADAWITNKSEHIILNDFSDIVSDEITPTSGKDVFPVDDLSCSSFGFGGFCTDPKQRPWVERANVVTNAVMTIVTTLDLFFFTGGNVVSDVREIQTIDDYDFAIPAGYTATFSVRGIIYNAEPTANPVGFGVKNDDGVIFHEDIVPSSIPADPGFVDYEVSFTADKNYSDCKIFFTSYAVESNLYFESDETNGPTLIITPPDVDVPVNGYRGGDVVYVETTTTETITETFSPAKDLSKHHFVFTYAILNTLDFSVAGSDIFTGLAYTTSYIKFYDSDDNTATYPLSLSVVGSGWNMLNVSRALPYRTDVENIDWTDIAKMDLYIEAGADRTAGIYLSDIEAVETLPRAFVILRFDDAEKTIFTRGLPLLEQYGFKGVIGMNASGFYDTRIYSSSDAAARNALLSGYGNIDDMCTEKQLKILDSLGWDVVSHTADHISLVGDDTEEAMIASLVSGQQALESLGITRALDMLIYPYSGIGLVPTPVQNVLSSMYTLGLSGQPGGPTPIPYIPDPLRMQRLEIANTVWADNPSGYDGIETSIQDLIDYGGVGQIMWHQVSEADVSEGGNLISLVEFLDAHRAEIRVVTMTELADIFNLPRKNPTVPEMIRTVDSDDWSTGTDTKYFVKPHDWGTHKLTNGGDSSMTLLLPPRETVLGRMFRFLCVPELSGAAEFTIEARDSDLLNGDDADSWAFDSTSSAGGNIEQCFKARQDGWMRFTGSL